MLEEQKRPPTAGAVNGRCGRGLFLSVRGHAAFTGGRDVFRLVIFEDPFRPVFLVVVIDMHGQEIVPLLQLLLITLRLDLGNAKANEPADDFACRGTKGCATERGHDRAGGDERSHAGNSKRADACEQTEDAACHAAGGRTGDGAFGGFGIFDVTDVMRARGVGQEDGDFGVSEALGLEAADNVFGLAMRSGDTEYGFLHNS